MESSSEIKKLKHREVERVRHHRLQALISEFTKIVPSVNKTNTQCVILKKTADFVKFLITENKRVYDTIEVDGYSSSQGTVTSSQGNLVIDEREQINNSFDENLSYREENERMSNKCPPLPSALFSPDQEYFDFNTLPIPISAEYQSTKWIDYQSPYPSPPSTSTSPPQPPPLQPPPPPPPLQYIQPIDHQNLNHHHQPHCPSCCCYSSHNNMDKQFINHNIKSFGPRDHLLTETIQDYGLADQSLSSWA